jgi:hypothetical protein
MRDLHDKDMEMGVDYQKLYVDMIEKGSVKEFQVGKMTFRNWKRRRFWRTYDASFLSESQRECLELLREKYPNKNEFYLGDFEFYFPFRATREVVKCIGEKVVRT